MREWARTCPASRARCAARQPGGLCFSHRREARFSRDSASPGRVRVDAPVAQERPVARTSSMRPRSISPIKSLPCRSSLRRRRRRRDAEERGPPEFQPGAALVPDAIDGRDVDAVGDGVAALHRLPGVALDGAVLLLLVRMPADGRRIEEHRGAFQGREPRALRYHWSQQMSGRCAPPWCPPRGSRDRPARNSISRRRRDRRDVHLAVEADCSPRRGRRACGRGRRALSKMGTHHRHAGLARHRASRSVLGPGTVSARFEERGVLALAEVVRAKEFGQATLRALRGPSSTRAAPCRDFAPGRRTSNLHRPTRKFCGIGPRIVRNVEQTQTQTRVWV